MKKFREGIKHPLIGAAGFNPVEYDKTRNTDPQNYEHDSADAIIIKLAGETLKPRTLRTFWLLYSCMSYATAEQYLAEIHENQTTTPINRDTLLTYSRTAKRTVKKHINENHDVKEQIIKAIKNEFTNAKTRNN